MIAGATAMIPNAQAHDPKFCAICKGIGPGWCGYRPHYLTAECWCIKAKTGRTQCELTEKWGLTEYADTGNGSAPVDGHLATG